MNGTMGSHTSFPSGGYSSGIHPSANSASDDLSYAGPPPILIAGDSEAAIRRATDTVENAGMRIGAQVAIGDAIERIGQQVAASAIWVELDSDGGAPMDALLDRLNGDARAGRYPAVVAGPIALVDFFSARLTDPAIELLIDGDEPARAAALAIATSRAARPGRLSDVASDSEPPGFAS